MTQIHHRNGNGNLIFWFASFLTMAGCVHAIYDPANIGIKTKTTYRHEPITGNVYEQHYETQQAPIQTITYRRTTTVERLSPAERNEGSTSVSSSGSSSSGNSHSDSYTYQNQNHNQNLFQYQQPQQYQYQQQGNDHFQQKQQYDHQQQQQEQYDYQQQQHEYDHQQHEYDHQHQHEQQIQYGNQQEIPLYNRNIGTQSVHSNWEDTENAITEYYTGCPTGHTGQLPYAYDCRRFLNCWHGRGHIQTCSAGTLFSPETLECDRPDKVVCGGLNALAGLKQTQHHNNQQQQQQTVQNAGNPNYRAGRLTDTTTENVDVLCPQGLSGLQPHPHDCTKFINCANGNIHVQQCGPGTAYSPSIMVCDHKDKVDCGTRAYHYGEGMIDMRSDLDNTHATNSKTNKEPTCPTGGSGLYPHPFDCTKFLNCANGITYIQSCGPGTAFDSANKVCEHKNKVNCADRTNVGGVESFEHSWSTAKTTTMINEELIVDILCPMGVTGLFAHPFDYTKFFNCVAGNMAIQNCVPGTVFSYTKSFCDLRDRVPFSEHVSYIVSEVSYEYSKMLMNCPPDTEGLHLYPYDCRKYIRCHADGRMLILECPQDTVFSLSSRQCIQTQKVRTTDRVKYFCELTTTTTTLTATKTTENSSQQGNAVGTEVTESKVGCVMGSDGLFPYPFSSINFIECRKGKIDIKTCDYQSTFSLSEKECVLTENINPNDFVRVKQQITEITSSYDYITQRKYVVCPNTFESGIFLHPFDCTKYIVCKKAETRVESCGSGTVYSISREQCINRNEVEAYDRVEYLIDTKHELSGESEGNNITNSIQEISCPTGSNAVHPHPYDCTKFIKCENGVPYVRSCEPGTIWSQRMEVCYFEDKVDSADSKANAGNSNSIVTEDHNRVSTNFQQTQTQSQATVSEIKCPFGISSGSYAHPFDYTKYFSCENGQSSIRSCRDGTVFSISKRCCEPAGSVSMSDRVEFVKEVTVMQTETIGYLHCPPAVVGVFVYPFDCTKYLRCVNGDIFLEYCAMGTVFSRSNKACMPKVQVQRTDRVNYIINMEYWPTEEQFTEVESSSVAECPRGATGMHPHPFDCTKYLNCANGQTYVQSCGPGTAWSKDMEVCDFIDKVDCTGRSGQQNSNVNGENFNERTHLNSYKTIVCPLDVGQGFYPHPFDSSIYFICQRGQSMISRCSPGKIFSISRRVCDVISSVSVTDHVQSVSQSHTHADTMFNQNSGSLTCPPAVSGTFLYPFDGSRYVTCNSGTTLIVSCPPGNVYSISNYLCMSKARVQRMDRVALMTETYNDLYYWQNSDAKTSIFCPIGVKLFQHPYDPSKYLDCTDEGAVVKSCLAGSLFSVSRGKCIEDNNVPSHDRCNHGLEHKSHGYQIDRQQTTVNIEHAKSDSPKCLPGASGLYAHPYDCTKYLNCANGMTYIQDCAPGTAWVSKENTCGFIDKADCSSHQPKSLNSFPDLADAIKCPFGATGLQPHPYDCTRFLNCDDGVTYVQACGPGTAWNSAMEVCDFIVNVDCSNDGRLYNGSNRGGKAITGTTRQWNQKTTTASNNGNWKPSQAHYYGSDNQNQNQQHFGSNVGGYTDRWSNMNMARPDAKSYGQSTSTATSGASTWSSGSADTASYGRQYDAVSGSSGSSSGYGYGYGSGTTKTTSETDRNWSASGSSIDRQTPTQDVLYMEGSLEPNRNYFNNIRTYTAPLAPFTPTTTSTTDSTKIYYAQPVSSEESIDQPYGHATSGRVVHPLPIQNRQNNSRAVNYFNTNGPNGWTPIIRHEDSFEKYPGQLPNTQLMPPYTTPLVKNQNPQQISPPATHLMPPLSSFDNGQKTVDSSERGRFPTSYDQVPSGTDIYPSTVDSSNLYGGLQPPPLSNPHVSPTQPNPNEYSGLKPTPLSPLNPTRTTFDESNLYGGLQPPSDNSNPSTSTPPTTSDSSNVRVYQIYPPLQNTSVVKKHGTPHYSSPYSGVTHSKNSTRLTPLANTKTPSSSNNESPALPTTSSLSARHVGSMPPSYNRHYYQSTTPSRTTDVEATDLVDTNLPISDALRMLLRPYFNRSGTVSDETAQQTESHIMNLVTDSHPTNKISSVAPPIPPPITVQEDLQKQTPVQTEEDVELILAGEQHSLITLSSTNGTHEVSTKFHAKEEKVNHTQTTTNWHAGFGQSHNRDFHLSHPNLPSPSFTVDTNSNDTTHFHHNWQNHQNQQHHHHHNHNHSPHHHNRDFHSRHPDLPNPFTTREGDSSIARTDLFDTENPYAESTTPTAHFDQQPRQSRANGECQFNCGNGKCVNKFQACDGVNDCGNRHDEAECAHLGYEVRLAGGKSRNMGRLEVKIRDKWGYVCDDKFGLPDAHVACRELGFPLGASELRGNSFYPPENANAGFLMDEVECQGNEASLKDCNFKGWGVHNCGPDEVAGVVCKVPLMKCPQNYWLCQNMEDCIPQEYLCDNLSDCPDESDESKEVCNSTIEYRLEGGRNAHEGRLEVKYRGEWGTVCDDDFGRKEAQVACNSFGFYGKAEIERKTFGPGTGRIWLDQVMCAGNESSIDQCYHWTWGEHNCNHTEDIGVRCTDGPPPRHLHKGSRIDADVQQQTDSNESEFYGGSQKRLGKYLNTQPNCGHFKANLLDEYAHPEERVISGTIAKRGRHPWQATMRTRGRGGISSHWCGAVLISDGQPDKSSHLLTAAHCVSGYQKGAYFIRMGDHYANIAESSEIDSYIENWYVHEKFRDQTHMNNDIALIVLKNPVSFNDFIQPICLPSKGNTLEPQRKCTISGWGSIKSGVSTPSNILRAAEVPIIPDETCKQPFVYGESLTDGMFCAGAMDESVDACDGDSGGPLVCTDNGKENLYGIISWGHQCGYPNKPGVYVRVEKYIDWINEKLNFSMQQK